MSAFIPTYLYIKQHKLGLKYFGKTVRDPMTYNGSGKYWKSYLQKHGVNVTTLWYQLFETREALVSYALAFSKEHNIALSEEWANLKPENGLDGFTPGHKYGVGVKHPELRSYNLRPEVIERRRENNKGNTHATALKGTKQSPEHIANRALSMLGKNVGKKHTPEHIQKRFIKRHCVHCGIDYSPTNYSRWHGDNCKCRK